MRAFSFRVGLAVTLAAVTLAAGTMVIGRLGAQPAGAQEAIEHVINGGFDDGTEPWWSSPTAPMNVQDGRACAEIAAGTVQPWDAMFGQDQIGLAQDGSYTFTFTASASRPVSIRIVVQLAQEPFTGALIETVPLDATTTQHTFTFTSNLETDVGQVGFQVGGNGEPWTFCLDDVSLFGPPLPPFDPDTGPRVRVNQVGYLPQGPKSATLVTDAEEALEWQLNDAAGGIAASGSTIPQGVDPSSSQNTHRIDFSEFERHGTGYTLIADGETSHPFDIGGDFYQRLRSDALAFFYHQRSGIPISADLVGEAYAHPAGHLGVPPNQGDTDVGCQPGVCDYRLDVRGGWYDAGDHGKYVVNGGISVAQLMTAFERTKTAATGDAAALGDGELRVPEQGNDVPDILDEARWQLEFLLSMQVPEGQPLAGMVHHKVHDANWTALPTRPDQDPELRELHPPSTAATLNLAATGAQCARLFARYDAGFAEECLTAAQTAWEAAAANPDRFAPESDNTGGGAYADFNVADEFYWAAAELFLTTGKAQYREAVTSSPMHTEDVFANGFYWGDVADLGRLRLATVPNLLPDGDIARIRESVVAAADHHVAFINDQAFGSPLENHVWGSNSGVANTVVVLAAAFDLTDKPEYRDASLEALDYLFGRNPLNQSYVSGYGENASHNQHHRFWANQRDGSLPNPPDGALAGGPNTGLEDPLAQRRLRGCPPAMCYIDHIDSFSTNEVTINWNAALSAAAAFAAGQGDGGEPPRAACRVRYQHHDRKGRFVARLKLTNTSREPVRDWTLSWSFTGDQTVTSARGAEVTQSGATVEASGERRNRRIPPRGTVSFTVRGESSGANPAPELFRLDGVPCAEP